VASLSYYRNIFLEGLIETFSHIMRPFSRDWNLITPECRAAVLTCAHRHFVPRSETRGWPARHVLLGRRNHGSLTPLALFIFLACHLVTGTTLPLLFTCSCRLRWILLKCHFSPKSPPLLVCGLHGYYAVQSCRWLPRFRRSFLPLAMEAIHTSKRW
jgi:hypothetical protein